ncbi:MAG: hypothetical protein WC658_05655, partial [Candidatus Omnitrophota bacterium]
MLNEIFSDYFAQKDNFFTRADARIKIIFIIAGIALVLLSPTPFVPSIVIIFTLAGLLCIKIPVKIVGLRLSMPLGIAITVLCVKIFFFHQTFIEASLLIYKIIGSTSL